MMEGKKPNDTLQEQAEKAFRDAVAETLIAEPLSGVKKSKYTPGVRVFVSGGENNKPVVVEIKKSEAGIYLTQHQNKDGTIAFTICEEKHIQPIN
ncbi:hypothetical protein A2740_01480 [Candidatus Nomurabacteria bacterium RIFCSPHIGHO2_01_FULL_43_16]|uniref:Uncharacterized protein n=2 Tax=Candidatus Nomuraibacteriota TaxID=1752729 RepID=A0A1F6YLP9_9BACT|nr:MAG: hypothetical protein UV13_C0010G0023 [Parcubacteria group bacterium GW2011_GWC1_42_21]KKS99983.1 MAG: hypothetical protein UV77_C0009G0023 [Candidatus Nomurabacteria bacterium GW2011_GWA1_43_17]KKT06825.1 MAG: hypothetical protein UV85_C0015G0023 [Candidatus Nomurabacteria bacterium GW2011_GWB1_43_19]KKT10837.1 MAG: hypothetical protein UV91_C0010G0024 [Candidatus Nomurabacteria bacterium GW2011_GWF2_43_24]KKT17795.1 MAG: hypothetical protein UW01_C0010G0023 [Candidatus Nomurabacteria b